MKLGTCIYPFVIAALATYGGPLLAQQGDDLDITMTVVDEDAEPDTAVEPIVLPDSAALQAVESSAQGLATANEARERGREFGQDTAEAARERGTEARESAAERVRDNIPTNALENIPENIRDNIPADVRDRLSEPGRPNNLPGPPGGAAP